MRISGRRGGPRWDKGAAHCAAPLALRAAQPPSAWPPLSARRGTSAMEAVRSLNGALDRHRAKTDAALAQYRAWVLTAFVGFRREFFP